MIPQRDIENWQIMWSIILNMTYHGTDIIPSLEITLPCDKLWKNDPDFEKVTFEYMWKKYSQLKDENGNYLEPKPVPQVKNLYIPFFLFECLGSSVFLATCFPNCIVTSTV